MTRNEETGSEQKGGSRRSRTNSGKSRRLFTCSECGHEEWWNMDDAQYECPRCKEETMRLMQNDRCNVCGRELMGRYEHQIGICGVCDK
jgi:ribosomal protein L37AE/L43A